MKDPILQAYARLGHAVIESDEPSGTVSDHPSEYLRMRAAIAEILQPRTILAVGACDPELVQAYSLGAPQSKYTSVVLETVSAFPGSLQAPVRMNPRPRGDKMPILPTGPFDVIHISAPMEERPLFDLLVNAARLASHIVIDGYFSQARTRDAVNDFVGKFSEDLESVMAYAGRGDVILLSITRSNLPDSLPHESGSGAIRQLYTSQYYLQNCGGFEFFSESRSRIVEDGRLRSMADLLFLHPAQRVLDLGAGRGELACLAAWSGAQVTAVDYSESAVQILRETVTQDRELSQRVQCICADVIKFEPESKFDVIIAGDLVEHLAQHELENLYSRIPGWLNPGGIFIVHTFPNRWFYDYDYPRKVREAQLIGARLPCNPRSRFEMLMHINEQSPRVLRRSLQRHFSHVKLWFGSPSDPAGSLLRRCSHRELAGYRDLYAIASSSSIVLEPERLFVSTPLSRFEFPMSIVSCPTEAHRSTNGFAQIQVTNSDEIAVLASRPPFPVYISYRWQFSGGEPVPTEGWRNLFVPALNSGRSHTYTVKIVMPSDPGEYQLIFSLVQETIFWLCDVRRDLCPAQTVTVY